MNWNTFFSYKSDISLIFAAKMEALTQKLGFLVIFSVVGTKCAASDIQINGEMQNHLEIQELAINGLRDDLNDAITNIVS